MNLLYGNFDFEHQLGRSKPRTLPAAVLAINAELSYALSRLPNLEIFWAAEPGDPRLRSISPLSVCPRCGSYEASQVPDDVNFVPWGWSPAMQQLAEKNGWHCECPDLAAVAKANSREFSARLEREWNVGLLQARTVHNVAELQTAVDASIRQTPSWVVKANFGMSAASGFSNTAPKSSRPPGNGCKSNSRLARLLRAVG